jgi:hypothetical protein
MTEPTDRVDPLQVEQQPVAEVLPGLYRAVLDAVADLELRGHREDAAAIRADATRAYSGAWNHGAARQLRILRARAARVAATRRPGHRESMLATLGRRLITERMTL